ncbi:MAG: hypothetical protein FWG66_09930 [Spirochaetes bacterium]|nr:hypothetical protein [Spirochaetota bacterium]
MDSKVDMNYRFLWDKEPTDEQLLVIMQEVAEDVRLSRDKISKQISENIEREFARVCAEHKIPQ